MLRPKIFQVVPLDDFTVNVYFDDGRIKLYDAKPLIKKGGLFAQLGDLRFFKERCTVLNHTLAWDIKGDFDSTECIDVCPDVLYED
jgi:hypothetical protein